VNLSVRWRFVGVAAAVAAVAAGVSGIALHANKPFDPARALSQVTDEAVKLGNGNTPNSGSVQGTPGHSFTISGSVQGLFPGDGYAQPVTSSTHPVYVYLTVTNPNSQDIIVTSLSYSVSDAGTACRASNLSPTTFTKSFSVRVPARQSLGGTAFPLPISMVPTAGNACQGQAFPLSFTGSAVQG